MIIFTLMHTYRCFNYMFILLLSMIEQMKYHQIRTFLDMIKCIKVLSHLVSYSNHVFLLFKTVQLRRVYIRISTDCGHIWLNGMYTCFLIISSLVLIYFLSFQIHQHLDMQTVRWPIQLGKDHWQRRSMATQIKAETN